MTERGTDLREILLRIQQTQNLSAHFCLDLGCRLSLDDPKPMIELIGRIVRYLRSLSDREIQIDLDAHKDKDQLVFIVPTSKLVAPEWDFDAEEVLDRYRATLEQVFESGKYHKFLITFAR